MVTRINLVPNPSFEVNTTGWLATGSYRTISRSTAQAFIGTACLAITETTDTPNGGGAYTSPYIAVTSGLTYTASAYMRAATVARQSRISINWLDVDGFWISDSYESTVLTSTTGWTRVSVTGVAPTGATQAYVEPYAVAQAFNETHYVDAVMFEQSATLGDYFDGNTTDANGWDYAWSGTAHNSTSVATSSIGSATGATYDFSGGSTVGVQPLKGSAIGGYAWAGDATGEREPKASATGAAAWAGSAAGASPYGGASTTGAYTFTGSASGAKPLSGAATGTYGYVGSGVGYTPFGAPSGLTATPVSATQVDLAWLAVNEATGYDIERDGVVIVTEHVGTTYSDTSLSALTEYSYRVRAVKV